MKLILLIIVSFSASFAYGQTWSCTGGASISFDYNKIHLQNGYSSAVNYPNSISYGAALNLSNNRVLIGFKALTSRRSYSLTNNEQPIQVPASNAVYQIQVSAQYYTFPITASYQILKINRLQLFAGAGLVAEWVPNLFKRQFYDEKGLNIPITQSNLPISRNFVIGGSLQAVAKYNLNDIFSIQIEPTFRYFPEVQTPYALGNRKTISALLTVIYKPN